MGLGKDNNFKSEKVDYSTPWNLFLPLKEEFDLEWDVCANHENHKLDNYWTIGDDALTKDWIGNCWINPPFSRDLNKWIKKAHSETKKHGGTKVVLTPVRSNTKWWNEIINDAEVRFVIGEVNFNDEPRGLWLPICILIFGEKAKVGTFSTIQYINESKKNKLK